MSTLDSNYCLSLVRVIFCSLAFLVHSELGHAVKTSFNDQQRGLVFGIGRSFPSLSPHSTQFEPVKQLSGEDDNFTKLQDYALYPSRIGLFWGGPFNTFHLYGRYLFNNKKTWNKLNAPTGVGRTTIKGMGVGAGLDLMLTGDTAARLMLSLSAEYIKNKAILAFQPDLDNKETITLNSSNYLIGAGITGELWLVDMWVLSLTTGYQHSLGGTWSVKSPGGDFFDVPRESTTLYLEDGTTEATSRFGGLFVEATLRLNFYFL
ncbi:hypothetical protein GW915_07800 [bacterium]|nr:hypothetical protein [bacterium]